MERNNLDILLIEDNIHDVNFIRYAMQSSGMDIRMQRLPDGAAAIDYLQGRGGYEGRDLTDRPRMILTDLCMPKLSGYDVLEAIKNDDKTREIPVVVMTTSSSDIDIEKSYKLGANSFLIKPMEIDLFMDKLVRVFHYWLDAGASDGDGSIDKRFCTF